jgi:succinyl-CoA synthetase beta subunit/malate-CoA ligase subunit beta
MGGNRWVVKAQIHAGGRGKAGGVKLCNATRNPGCDRDMFGMKLVTHQTGPEGKGVYRVYVEAATPIDARSIWASCLTAPRSGS